MGPPGPSLAPQNSQVHSFASGPEYANINQLIGVSFFFFSFFFFNLPVSLKSTNAAQAKTGSRMLYLRERQPFSRVRQLKWSQPRPAQFCPNISFQTATKSFFSGPANSGPRYPPFGSGKPEHGGAGPRFFALNAILAAPVFRVRTLIPYLAS